jgi:uncharacterized protein
MKYGVLFGLSLGALVHGQTPEQKSLEYVKANYTKYEYRIPMRDGVKLFTSVYVPKDDSKPYPIMLSRTPYSVAPYGVDQYKNSLGPSELFQKESYVFAYQDVRGRYMSEGEFDEVRPYKPVKKDSKDIDESSDAWDTIDWLVKHVPNNNGRVGIWGISYPGFFASEAMIDAHPALKAASPQAPVTDYYMGDDSYHNGAFFLAANFGFYANFGKAKKAPELPSNPPRFDFKTPDAYDFYLRMGSVADSEKFLKNESRYWTEQYEHPNYDEFARSRNAARYIKDIKPAVLVVGGWFDAEDLSGPLKVFRAMDKGTLVMGPWSHGGFARGDGDKLGSVVFNAKTSVFFRENIELPFFNYYLKDKTDPKLPRAYLFETGTNQWRKYDSWPPQSAKTRTLYLQSGGKLAWEPPKDDGFDEYVSDPNRPVPYIGYIAPGMAREYMVDDQRFASRRTDVLSYQTEPLEDDLTVAGPVSPQLFVSTTGTDSDFVVKLIDVYPNDYPNIGGYQQLVRGEPFRGKFRHSFEKPEPFTPGKMDKIEFSMPDINHTFRRGHRIMVQIQSSWFPLTDRNPQKFVDIPHAKPADFVKATERVSRSKSAATGIKLSVVE